MNITTEIRGLRGTMRMFKKLTKQSPVAAHAIVRESGKRVTQYARERVPVKSGALRRSIRRKTIKGENPHSTVSVGAGIPYAHSMESGSKPHLIPGNPVWDRRIHPGTKATHFWSKSVNQVAREMPEIIRIGWNKHFQGELRI